ncbi:hypothetical protein FHG87_018961 [Trinorchestia longiramus]|nr:hypothetical protein FHG87_018961 [Trinorchestia longiramus]
MSTMEEESGHGSEMADLPLIVGIVFMVVGGAMSAYGFYSCMNTSGSRYNTEDVDAMVAAAVLDQEKERQETEALFEDFKPGLHAKKRKVLVG